ncbi:MAG: o-succinylbenzoate synthase [Bacteroidales bacterium]|nr:o-succinylbenzoate synthase [Bacteroidales bacterium]MCF8457260.1 o-succinylbenzoate synthase [Bacteroidales bacterium]
MLKATFTKHKLSLIQPAATSRGILKTRDTWFLLIFDSDNPGLTGIGEIAPLPGLSPELEDNFEFFLKNSCKEVHDMEEEFNWRLQEYPSLRFGFEMAFLDMENKGNRQLFPSKFSTGEAGIEINGLIWMGSYDYMLKQVEDKVKHGFKCIKLKIGAIDFEDELDVLRKIRKNHSSAELEIRVDANGAFTKFEALEKLKRLSEFKIHSIEQPIKAGQLQEIAKLCDISPIPIALDEELIGINDIRDKEQLLKTINPHFIVLKPSLTGGFAASEEWIELADDNDSGWWITSALESNVGLNALSQWTYTLKSKMPQGLGTGHLFSNNVPSPLILKKNMLHYNPDIEWDLSRIYG